MILCLLPKRNELLAAIRRENDNWEFRRCEVHWNETEDKSGSGYIWDEVDDDLRKVYLEAETLALAVPASMCLVKRIVVTKMSENAGPGYGKWRAGIELPGGADSYSYGFMPLMKDSGDDRSEVILTAVSAEYLRRLNRAVSGKSESREVQFVPEYLGLAELAGKSAGDCDQVGLVHFDHQGAVVVILRDSGFFKGRYFRIVEGGLDETVVDIEVFLLSVSRSGESFPLILTGSGVRTGITWNPILPAFLGETDLDFSSVWGVTEFIAGGGRCELRAGH